MRLFQLADADRFMPHGMCYLWEPGLLWTHVLSDILIAAAYFAISLTLGWLVWRSAREAVDEAAPFRRLPFWWMFLAFGLFIVACGFTHVMGAWNVWNADYFASGGVKVVTALASVATAIAFPPLVPRALALVRQARESEMHKRELLAANERISELAELKTRFFANVSHELRTPLTLIAGPVARLLDGDGLDERQRAELEIVLRNAQTLHRHVDDLLDITRLESGEVRPDYRRADLAGLVRRAAAHFDGLAVERDIDFVVDAPPSLPAVVDPGKIERIVLNLVSNAFKFTPAGGVIRIALSTDGPDGGRLVVADSGPGVPEPMREAVFERFRQIDEGSGRAFGGTGLGLAIVREFVDLHGGDVRVEEAPEGGAAFVVDLPLDLGESGHGAEGWLGEPEEGDASSAVGSIRARTMVAEARAETTGGALVSAPADRAPEPALPDASGDSLPEARPLVLIVEDNAEMSRFLEDVLSEQADTFVAVDGAEGLRRAEERRPDLILSDVMMPGMTGDRFLEELRAREGLHSIPFLVLTARDDQALRMEMLEAGAQDFLTKPFMAGELRARVANWLQVSRSRALLQRELAVTEEDLESLAREVSRRRRELEAALEAARLAKAEEARASRAKTDFLAVMSHELRTPLAAIIGYAGILDEGIAGELNQEQRSHVRRVDRNADHLLELIDQILDFAQLEREELSTRPTEIDLRSLVEDVESVVRPAAEARGLALTTRIDEGVPDPYADESRVRQILLNLLTNAVKYTDEGWVRLSVGAGEGTVRFEVADTGIGIATEHRERIFDPFWQIDQSATRKAAGVGLGLSISRRLARRLGGDLTLLSSGDDGSVFVLEIPTRNDGGA